MISIFKNGIYKKYLYFKSFIPTNILFILFIIVINQNINLSYYIIPFKHYTTSLSDLYNIYKNISQDEIFLNYTNTISLYTSLKINDSQMFQGFLQTKEICTSFLDNHCISDINSILVPKNNHININISNIFNKINENTNINIENKKCINGVIGLGLPDNILSPDCISIIDQCKKNDNTIKSYSWNILYYNLSINNNNNCDGEIIIGILPHEYQPFIFSESNYKTVYSFEEYDIYNNKQRITEYCIRFDSIYFYENNNVSYDNLIESVRPEGKDGYINFNNGMIQSSYEYYYNIKKYFFNKYINLNICEELTFSQFYHTFMCYKNKLNLEEFYKNFPILYFKSVGLNYIFELTSKELFKEENNKIYFMIFSSDLNSLKWSLGELFLKKYYFTFNQEQKSIGFYINTIISEKEKNNNSDNNNNYENENENKKSNIGLIILIIAIIFIIIEVIICAIWLWNKKYGNNRRKRANELKDDNYDYISDNSDNNKIINEN